MKSFIFSLDTNLKNFPNRDRVLKSRIENTSYDLLELITLTNMSKLKDDKRYVISSKLSMLDFYFECSFKKKYINQKQLETICYKLSIMDKMIFGWLNDK